MIEFPFKNVRLLTMRLSVLVLPETVKPPSISKTPSYGRCNTSLFVVIDSAAIFPEFSALFLPPYVFHDDIVIAYTITMYFL